MAFNAKDAKQIGEKWLARIRAAEVREDDWIKQAKRAEAIYLNKTTDNAQKYYFNILHSNVETIVPAIYSATPKPDIRRRFGDRDPVGKAVSQILERCLLVQIDDGSLDIEMEAVAQSAFVAGRGMIRIRLHNEDVQTGESQDPVADAVDETAQAGEGGEAPDDADMQEAPVETPQAPQMALQRLSYEAVAWNDIRIGPSKRWEDVPWLAFRHMIDSETIDEWQKDGKVKAQIGLEPVDAARDADEQAKGDVEVWEVWCKSDKTVKFIRGLDGLVYKDEPDPLELQGFFPASRPVQPIEVAGKMCPVAPFEVYADLADELDRITRRIRKISEGIKVRGGAAAGETMAGIADIAKLDDNEIAELKGVEAFAQQGGLEKAITWWPIEKAVAALQILSDHRDRVKSTIYEVTGISDIVRGASNADETATAQQIKSQWGSLRIQKMQRMLERCVRDVFVISAELVATKFTLDTMQAIAGMEITPEMQAMLTSDVVRTYRIDVETDSTIKADLTKSKSEMSEFLQGTAGYAQSIGPLVAQGAMDPIVAVEIYSAFARVFRLGKTVEDALEGLADNVRQKVEAAKSAPPQEPPPDPAMVKAQADAQRAKAEFGMKQDAHNQSLTHAQQKHDLEIAQKQRALGLDEQANAAKVQDQTKQAEIIAQMLQAITQTMQQGNAQLSAAIVQATNSGNATLAEALMTALAQNSSQILAAVNAPREVQAVLPSGRKATAISKPAMVN